MHENVKSKNQNKVAPKVFRLQGLDLFSSFFFFSKTARLYALFPSQWCLDSPWYISQYTAADWLKLICQSQDREHKAKDIYHTINRLEERGVERRSSLKGRERVIVNQTNIGTVSEATLGKLLRDGVERIIMGFSERIDTILN